MNSEFSWVPYLFSGTSLIGSAIAFFLSSRANKTSGDAKQKALDAIARADDAQTKARQGSLELQLQGELVTRTDRINDVERDLEVFRNGRKLEDLNPEDKTRLAEIVKRHKNAWEGYLNVMETGCALYRDGKTDKVRFQQTFHSDIKRLFAVPNEHPVHDMLYPDGNSDYHAIWAVHKKWHNLEENPPKL